jgi:UDP-2,3-diacylglucosamine pyrophosphatase LpxH
MSSDLREAKYENQEKQKQAFSGIREERRPMNQDSPPSPPATATEESIIIVSDVHLGGKGAHHDKFCEFLNWIKNFPQRSSGVQCKMEGDLQTSELEIDFVPPTKLILLGDIIDLWDPEDQDRNNVIRRSLKPLSILHTLTCEKVYVTGNHDADVGEMFGDKNSFSWGDGYSFSIYSRHYPEPDTSQVHHGLAVNQTNYTFLHGHQFDGEQIPYIISEILREPFDPIDTLMDLANMSVSKILRIRSDILIACLWILFLILAFVTFPYQAVVQNAAVIIIYLTVSGALLRKYPDARRVLGERKPKWWERALIEGIFIVPFIALIACFAAFILWPGAIPSPASLLLFPTAAIFTIFAAVIVLPRLIGFIQRGVYSGFKSRDKTVEEVLNDGFVDERDTIKSEVIVFGHTHRAGYKFRKFAPGSGPSPGAKSPVKLFVNTGCWVDTGDTRPVDIFVYLNRTGLYLLEWKGPQEINCPRTFLQAITT